MEAMTKEQFDKLSFKKGMHILYRGRRYELAAVDFERREISFTNENGNEIWSNCKHIEPA
jgi:hypothetical protein